MFFHGLTQRYVFYQIQILLIIGLNERLQLLIGIIPDLKGIHLEMRDDLLGNVAHPESFIHNTDNQIPQIPPLSWAGRACDSRRSQSASLWSARYILQSADTFLPSILSADHNFFSILTGRDMQIPKSPHR